MEHKPGYPYELADRDTGAGQTLREDSPERRAGRSWVWALAIFVVVFGVYAAFAGSRVTGPSPDPHFAYLATTMNRMVAASLGDDEVRAARDGLLPFELERKPPHRNDWASFRELELSSGEVVRGNWVDSVGRGKFKLLDGNVMRLEARDLRGAKRTQRYFVSFPPGPAVLMMPLAAVSPYEVNDVLFTIFFGALNVVLLFMLLERLSRGGRSGRSRSDNLWLTLIFAFGSVHFWCSVLGQVWFTALVVGVTFALLYIWCAIDARRPLLAGLFLACAFATRTPLVFTAIFFYAFAFFPGGRLARGEELKTAVKRAVVFSIPCLVVGLGLMWVNHLRFESFTEFGHTYLADGRLGRIQRYGLFNAHFLSKNLTAMFTLMPKLQAVEPYVRISKHGMSLLITTPALVWLLWPKRRESAPDRFWYRICWATVLVVAIPHLLYQNTGYEQFGYRFSMDYLPYLIVLLAIGRKPFTPLFKALALVGVAVNAFGAVTFKRMRQFYFEGIFP